MPLSAPLWQLHPAPSGPLPLPGLYLEARLHTRQPSFWYTNFVASLDGRIALAQDHGRLAVPRAIANARDWRLYMELAAQADALVVSGRYVRELAAGSAQAPVPLGAGTAFVDLLDWRVAQGLSRHPAVVIVSASLDLPASASVDPASRTVFAALPEDADAQRTRALEVRGIRILRAGSEGRVDGALLRGRLNELGLRRVYSIAGPSVCATLLQARVLNRLYLTQSHRLLGGERYATLYQGATLLPPINGTLAAQYLDPGDAGSPAQCFQVFDLDTA